MLQTAVTPEMISRSVMAVPPLASHPDLSVNPEANAALIRHIEAGGVRTLLYAGNANVYNLDQSRYAAMLDMLSEAAGDDSWVIPGIGPDYGKMLDQARLLKHHAFPTALTLPTTVGLHPAGVETGLRHTADAMGKPLMVYIKSENYLSPDQVARLMADGVVCGIKYAIDRTDPAQDSYLSALVQVIDRKRIVSGMGERPAVTHLRQFDLGGYTSGLVCIAPARAMAILRAAQTGDFARAGELAASFTPLENAREKLGFIRVLHGLITMSGIADMGPILPLLADLDAGEQAGLREMLAAFVAPA